MTVTEEIKILATRYAQQLALQMTRRDEQMRLDDTSHYLIYRVLGIPLDEGWQIDLYQNKGRFLYKYAGAFLEQATFLCFKATFPDAQKLRIPNTQGQRPRQFEIDCAIGSDAIEIKWRDATTDGDHITKEHTRLQVVKEAGFTPIRVMFYPPNREQATRIQATLQTIYLGIGGEFYVGEHAWVYVKQRTQVDLKSILEEIAQNTEKGDSL